MAKKAAFAFETPFNVFNQFVTTPLGVVAGLIMLALALITTSDVTFRATVGGSVPGALEVSEVLLVMGVFMAFGAAQASGAHVSTSVVTERLPDKARKAVMKSTAALILVLLAVLTVATTQEAIIAFVRGDYRFGLVHMPLWPAKVAVAIGMIVYFVEFIRSYLLRSEIPLAEQLQVEQAQTIADPDGRLL